MEVSVTTFFFQADQHVNVNWLTVSRGKPSSWYTGMPTSDSDSWSGRSCQTAISVLCDTYITNSNIGNIKTKAKKQTPQEYIDKMPFQWGYTNFASSWQGITMFVVLLLSSQTSLTQITSQLCWLLFHSRCLVTINTEAVVLCGCLLLR